MAFLGLLAALPSGDAGRDEWAFWHARDHLDIRQAVQNVGRGNLPAYILSPIVSFGLDVWAESHQQAHNDANGSLDLAGNNLLDISFSSRAEEDEWLFLNFMEHAAMHQTVGI